MLKIGGATLAAALLLTSCSIDGRKSEGSEDRTDVNVVSPAQPANLDPHLSTLQITAEVTRPIYETLIGVNEEYGVVPVLAESYERSDDGLTFTFHLREGVKFQDGSDLDSNDVVVSMERWLRNSTFGESIFPGATWTAIDPLTAELKVTKPSFLHEVQLSNRLTQFPAVIPSEIAEAAADEPITEYIGTGSYEFIEWKSDQFIKIKKWAGYKPGQGEASGLIGDKTGTIEDITFNFVADPSTRTMGLQSGQYDIVTEVPYDSLDQIYDDPKLEVGAYLITPQQMVFSPRTDGPVVDVDFRQAINAAVDRDPIMMAAVGGNSDLYELVHHQMSKSQESIWNTEVGKDGFNRADADEAKELLAKAGYNGTPVTLIVTRDYTEAYNSAVVLQEQLKAIGVSVELEAMEWGAYIERFLNDAESWDLTVFPAVTEPEPSTVIGFIRDFPGYIPSSRFDEMSEKYRAIPTLEEASQYYDEMQQYIEDVRPLVKLGDVANVYAATKTLDVPVFDSSIRWWELKYKG
ncbi:ABC transporter substrate-binding protein [Agromyces italicus]|uniref:ABC transporter substrate-binding protein n=1 Tax=Agromyces italicus TaxID=279572 RepID=UPI0003B35D4B|nr:ABC transporter substrate-binding protein [Agromyces italicus]